MWVLPPNLPAFCSSSVILGTVGDLMPITTVVPPAQEHSLTIHPFTQGKAY